MNLEKALEEKSSFILTLNRGEGDIIGFQSRFWKLIEQLKSHDIPWFCEETADEHFLCWHLLGLAWKYDWDTVSIVFRYQERFKQQWNEDEEIMETFFEDVYGFALVQSIFIEDLGLPVYNEREVTGLGVIKEKELDMSGLLFRFAG